MITKDTIDKADLAVASLITDGGYLNPEQSDKFLRMVIDQPTIINQIRSIKMSSPQKNIDKIGFGNRILRRAPTSGVALDSSDRSAPTTGQVTLDTREYIAEVHIPYDVLEDNIEKGNLDGTIMSMISERVSIDMEEWLIRSITTDPDPFFATINGLVAQINNDGHTVDVSTMGAGATALTLTKRVFKEAIKELPTKYFRVPKDFRFWTSYENELEFRDTLADRATELGDYMIEGVRPVYAYGVPVRPNSFIPNTQIILTHPQNIIVGIQRQILIERERDIRRRTLVIVLTLRMDFKLEEADATVLVTGINA